ncbi:MAG: DUF1868 domain-containing protein [Spirulinaceae cyanobacterium RM2_2_10]|nr:DUF1868 domain-containing protein [Spirulinaceae cyanobacterium SM2_1_0]NJO19762.1 DUF1868 domain-containing protein [Spirulinaceae cyanobacterium RM2_2_10]
MDEPYQAYLNRVARLTLPAAYRSQLATIQPSPKFAGDRPAAFPGYSITTPVGLSDADNTPLYESLIATQQELQAQLGSDFVVPVPPESFHLTLADLIWDRAYQDALKAKPDFAAELCDCVEQSFQRYRQIVREPSPLALQVMGLIVRPRAIVVGLVPHQEPAYNRLLHLRRSLYQNPALIGLGIEQQYNFTAHITLGYISQVPSWSAEDVMMLAERLIALNDAHWLDTKPQMLWVKQAELQKFADMTHFFREPEFPVVAV